MADLQIPMCQLGSSVQGKVPNAAQLLRWQIAINDKDRAMYTLDSNGVVIKLGVAPSDLGLTAFSNDYNDLINKPNIAGEYVLPAATVGVIGGVRPGLGLTVDVNGILTASVQSVNSRTGNVVLGLTDVGLPADFVDPNSKIRLVYLPDSVTGALNYVGTWNATTNTPTIPAATADNKGHYYRVAVAGSTSIDGITNWGLGDWLISDGSIWTRLPGTSGNVQSVNTQTGDVLINAGNLPGLSTVGRTGKFDDLTEKPTSYPPAPHTQAAETITGLASVATSGSFNDLVDKPLASNICQISVNVKGTPTILESESYLMTRTASFGTNFTGSYAKAVYASGTGGTMNILVNNVQVGSIVFGADGVGSFTSVSATTSLVPGDQIAYVPTTTNMTNLAISLRGLWTSN